MVSSFSVRSCTCDLRASISAGSGGGGPLIGSGISELCEALGDANTCPGVNCGFNVSTNPVCDWQQKQFMMLLYSHTNVHMNIQIVNNLLSTTYLLNI